MMRLREVWIPLYLFACLVLGGASNGGFLANGLLQLAGAILMVWALWNPAHSPLAAHGRFLCGFVIAIVLVILLQFVPLPPRVWELGVGRAELAQEGAAIGIAYTPLLWGLLPHEALKSAVWLVPAIALGVALLRLPDWQPQHLAWAILAAMVLSVILGAVQLGAGAKSAAYFYAVTNFGSTVGFFANSNHLASLLLVSLPFIAALIAYQIGGARNDFDWAVAAIGGALMVTALVGIAVNGSLAGFALAGPVLAASAMVLVSRSVLRKLSLVVLPTGVAGGLAWLLLSEEGSQLLALEEAGSSGGGREEIWASTLAAIEDFLPLGSGLGTFAEVYPRYEDPALVADVYINHAHNDYLELVLETGVLAAPVMLMFLVWWARTLVRVWLARSASPFALAGAIASAAILVHSIVDYPLRTAAISSIFAVSLCLMVLQPRSLRSARVPDAKGR